MADTPNAPSAGEFLWRLVWAAFSRSLGTADLISGVLGALAAYLFRDSPTIMSDLAWQIPVFSLAAVTLIRLAAAPYWIWREERRKAVALAESSTPGKPQLDIVFERFGLGSAFEHEERVQTWTIRRFRVGVRHSGRETISRVQVELQRIEPQTDPPLPVPLLLHLMNDKPQLPGDNVVHQRDFPLDPDETRYVDVVAGRDGSDSGFSIVHIVKDVRRAILPNGTIFTLTLFAHGNDALSATRHFWVTQSPNTQGRVLMTPPPGDTYGQVAR
jgi:hypothetical protein